MPKGIRIIVGSVTVNGELDDTPCAEAVCGMLPIETEPREWGDEFYFEIGLTFADDETSTTSVRIGDIGFWPPGNALAVFFGRTPASRGADPVPASAVNIVGRITGDATVLRKAKGAPVIRIEKA